MEPTAAFKLAEQASKSLQPLFKKIGSELGNMAGDQLRFVRWKTAVKILERSKKFCLANKISYRQIPLKFLVPFLEGASLEDIEKPSQLVDMWASLLTSRIRKEDARSILYISVIRAISSTEAADINRFAKSLVKDKNNNLFMDEGFDPDSWNITDFDEFSEYLSLDINQREIHFSQNSQQPATYTLDPDPEHLLRKFIKRWVFPREDMFCDRFGWEYFHGGESYGGFHETIKHRTLGAGTIDSLYALGAIERKVANIRIVVPNTPNSFLKLYVRTCALKTFGLDFIRSTHVDLF